MTELRLDPLNGLNPLGFLAALGVLDVLQRVRPDRSPTLYWSDGIRPMPTVTGADGIEDLVSVILDDRESWQESVVLQGWGAERPDDIKPDPKDVSTWFRAAELSAHAGDLPLLHALISEGALAGKGDSKPTHLHFTAGQQKFLEMCRQLRDELDRSHIVEALDGPWTRSSKLPVLGWDNEQGERLFAYSRKEPSSGKKTGVPGADWLAFLGLRFLPVSTTSGGELVTAGCAPTWKVGGHLTWPLWSRPLGSVEVSMLLVEDQSSMSPVQRELRGITRLSRAPIRRADQGGYGSFGPTLPI